MTVTSRSLQKSHTLARRGVALLKGPSGRADLTVNRV